VRDILLDQVGAQCWQGGWVGGSVGDWWGEVVGRCVGGASQRLPPLPPSAACGRAPWLWHAGGKPQWLRAL
jgi:hypothetical protein